MSPDELSETLLIISPVELSEALLEAVDELVETYSLSVPRDEIGAVLALKGMRVLQELHARKAVRQQLHKAVDEILPARGP